MSESKEKKRVFTGLTAKLLLWFLPITLVPVVIFGLVGYFNATNTLKKESKDLLMSIAGSKELMVEEYFRNLENQAMVFLRNPVVIEAMRRLDNYYRTGKTHSQECVALDNRLRQFLQYYTREAGTLHDILLINNQATIVFTVKKGDDYETNLLTGPFKDTQLAHAFKQAKTLSEMELSAFEFYPPSNQIAAFLGLPFWGEGRLLGVLCLQINPQEINKVVSNYRGLGESGEIVIGTINGYQVDIIAPLRHDPEAAFKMKIPIDSHEAIPIQLASQGIEGFGKSIDYRGKNVIARWHYLHTPEWGIVVKLDENEAFAPARKYRNLIILIGSIIIVCVVPIVIVVSRSVAAPIIKLTKTTELIANGDLTYRVNIQSKDEIGVLANSFNRAIDRIKASLTEKDILLAEIHHRVKNNLQIISSILNLQSNLTKDNKTTKIMDDCQHRIQSMALVHEALYKSRDFSKITLQNYLDELVIRLVSAYEQNTGMVTTKVEAEDVQLGIDTVVPIGLITNELITNSMKHAFLERKDNEIRVALNSTEVKGEFELIVSDNGIGIREDIDIRDSKTLGLLLVTNLAELQLNGKIEIKRDKGTEFRIRFKEARKPHKLMAN